MTIYTTDFFSLVEHAKYFPSSTYEDLVDVIGTRLGKRQTERSPAFEEPSEELRIAWLDVADLLVNHIPDDIRAIATARILDIVKLAVQDPSPDAVRKGGGILNALAQTCPREMALCGNIPMNLAIQLLHYKHAHTRVVGLQVNLLERNEGEKENETDVLFLWQGGVQRRIGNSRELNRFVRIKWAAGCVSGVGL